LISTLCQGCCRLPVGKGASSCFFRGRACSRWSYSAQRLLWRCLVHAGFIGSDELFAAGQHCNRPLPCSWAGYGVCHCRATALQLNRLDSGAQSVAVAKKFLLQPSSGHQCMRVQAWSFPAGLHTVTAIVNSASGLALALGNSTLWSSAHGPDEPIADAAYGTTLLQV
jgi:hypothetical protein